MSTEASYDEKELLVKIAGGDEAAYRIVFDRYWDQVYTTAFFFTKSPEVSEDLAQDIFARIWIKRESLAAVDRFESFLYIFARNIIFDRLRRKEFAGHADDHLRVYFTSQEADPAVQLEFKEFNDQIQRAIARLTPQQQMVFRLSRFDGLNHAEIAARMALSQRTVKNHMVSALALLRKHLQQYSGQLLVFIWMESFLHHN